MSKTIHIEGMMRPLQAAVRHWKPSRRRGAAVDTRARRPGSRWLRHDVADAELKTAVETKGLHVTGIDARQAQIAAAGGSQTYVRACGLSLLRPRAAVQHLGLTG